MQGRALSGLSNSFVEERSIRDPLNEEADIRAEMGRDASKSKMRLPRTTRLTEPYTIGRKHPEPRKDYQPLAVAIRLISDIFKDLRKSIAVCAPENRSTH